MPFVWVEGERPYRMLSATCLVIGQGRLYPIRLVLLPDENEHRHTTFSRLQGAWPGSCPHEHRPDDPFWMLRTVILRNISACRVSPERQGWISERHVVLCE